MCNNNKQQAVAVAMAVALLALLFAAGEADECRVNRGTVLRECASCGSSGAPSDRCCDALRNADFGCLCRNYWGRLKGTSYENCAKAIPSKCNLPNARCY